MIQLGYNLGETAQHDSCYTRNLLMKLVWNTFLNYSMC